MDSEYEHIDTNIGDMITRQFWMPDVREYEPVVSPLLFTEMIFIAEFGRGVFTYSNAPYSLAYIRCVGACTFNKEDVWGDVSNHK